MIILGIDPGTTSIGYAIIESRQGQPVLNTSGLLKTGGAEKEERMRSLDQELRRIIKKWGPSILAIERVFLSRNQKTAMAVSEARGAILLITSLAGLDAHEYTPLEVKKAVTGAGSADKLQVEKMVRMILADAKHLRASDDVFDAMAVALTCFYQLRSTVCSRPLSTGTGQKSAAPPKRSNT